MSEVRADTAQYSFKVAGQVFQVLAFDAHEEISELFGYSLRLLSPNPEVDIASIVRQDAEVTVRWGELEKQYFGLVASFSQTGAGLPGLGGVDNVYGEYQAVVVPTLWLLDQKSNCRIFQKMSADQIITRVLDERGLAGKYSASLRAYPPREYCVQYGETDLAFLRRLMEEEGIFFYFTHEGKELLVLGDTTGDYGKCGPEASVEFRTGTGVEAPSQEYLSGLTYEEAAHTGQVKRKDFDYRAPTRPLLVTQAAPRHGDLERYDYRVERYADDARGRSLAKVAVEARATLEKTLAARGDWRSASAGCVFGLSHAYRGDLDRDWLVVRCEHRATQLASGGVTYEMSLLAIPADVMFRPLPRTPRPTLSPQTATVVGPPGEKVYMDEMGRAKVQFRWDLDGSSDDESSCWIRVAQPYAGLDEKAQKKHGFQWHPMIGDEVVVEFIDGSPDAPIVTGSVYNAVNTPLVDPRELVRGRILTPYQHELLLDDANTTIRLDTGCHETLEMVDKDDRDGKVTLSTQGGEVLRLEDHNPDVGNLILLSTADDHHIQLSERDQARGIMIKTARRSYALLDDAADVIRLHTQGGHDIRLRDPEPRVEVTTSGGHAAVFDDAAKKITLTSAGGSRFEINDDEKFIELASATGEQRMRIDFGGTGYTIDVTKGTVGVNATAGEIKIKGQSVVIESQSTLELKAPEITINGKSSITNTTDEFVTQAGTISETAKSSAKLKGTTVEVAATADLKLSGAEVSSEASGFNTVKGTLVKIN
jgi:type VI secretion system VgrG family protein